MTIKSLDHMALEKTLHDRNVSFALHEGMYEIRVESSQEALALVARHREHIIDFEFRHGTMDDAFLSLTGRG